MACSICGAEADLILLRGGPEGRTGESLCARCARDRGLRTKGRNIEIAFEELLGGRGVEERDAGPCPLCGMELSRLRRSGLLGCSSCVERFRRELGAFLTEPSDPPPPATPSLPSSSLPALLESRLRIGRILPDLPLPGGPAGPAPAGPRLLPLLEGAGLAPRRLEKLGAEERRLVASLLPPPSWLADPSSLVLFPPESSALGLLDCVDHLSLRVRRPGLALGELETELRSLAARLDPLLGPARDPELGLLCARIAELGEGLGAELLLHLPALERRGLLDRLLRETLAEGWSMEGRYGSERGSAGALWVLSAGEGRRSAPESLALAGLRLAEAEEGARSRLLSTAREEVLDLGARAFGLLSWARSLSLVEALDLLSDLRLGALAGLLPDLAEAPFAPLLVELTTAPQGPDRGAPSADRDRARRLRSIFGLSEPFVSPGPLLRTEGGR